MRLVTYSNRLLENFSIAIKLKDNEVDNRDNGCNSVWYNHNLILILKTTKSIEMPTSKAIRAANNKFISDSKS